MGQETSQPVLPDTPPQTLSDRSLAAVADLIKSGRAKRIVVMTGAGISTAAGIPDFRSPKTGLYHNLARLNLPHPEAVFDIDFFREDPRPFYVLAKELYPGNFHPTVSHAFIALLARKKLLRMLFTQNIDCLERAAGVPPELIIEAHGSFATQRCIECKTAFPDAEMRAHVERGDPPSCLAPSCDGLVKPDIVFFGERLPDTFYEGSGIAAQADLVLVLGTSLTVHPFAGLPRLAPEHVPRLLLNMERVGDLGTRADDVLSLGECDAGVRALADALGWRDELEGAWEGAVGAEEARRQRRSAAEKRAGVEDELDRLAKQMEDKLELSEGPAEDDHGGANLGEKQEKDADAAAARGDTTGDKAVSTWEGVGGGEEGDEEKEKGEAKGAEDRGSGQDTATTSTATTTTTGTESGEQNEHKDPVANASVTTLAPSTDTDSKTTNNDRKGKEG